MTRTSKIKQFVVTDAHGLPITPAYRFQNTAIVMAERALARHGIRAQVRRHDGAIVWAA